MAKIYSQLEKAQIENRTTDPTAGTTGLIYQNTVTGKPMLDDGSTVRPLLRNDAKLIVGNSATAADNIRLHRGGASTLQLVKGGDVTAEGSKSTSLAQLSHCIENYTEATKPSAGNSGRVIFVTDKNVIEVDTGSTWLNAGGGLSPWATTTNYAVGEVVTYQKYAYICIVAHTSGSTIEADVAAGKWTLLNQPQIAKNYMPVANNFEDNDTAGWTVVHSTLDSTSKLPNQASGSWTAADTALTLTTVTGGSQLAGVYSGEILYTQSVGHTSIPAGDMAVSQAYKIDPIDAAKVLQFRFGYKNVPGVASPNFSGTSSNTFGVAIYVVDGAQAGTWIQPAGVYNFVQASGGVGICTGTWQAPIDMTQFRLAIYCVNALTVSSGTYGLVIDEFYCGPQPFAQGPAMSDWTTFTPSGSWTTNTTYSGFEKREGDVGKYQVKVQLSGAPNAATLSINLPAGRTIDTAKLANTGGTARVGTAVIEDNGFGYFTVGEVYYNGPSSVVVSFGFNNVFTGLTYTRARSDVNATIPITFASGDVIDIKFEVPISGWTSNTISSADTDQKIVAMRAYSSNTTTLTANTETTLQFNVAEYDTTGSFSTGTGIYTISTSGYYEVSGSLGIGSSPNWLAGRYASLAVAKNGTTPTAYLAYWVAETSSTINPTLQGTVVLYCNAGDTLRLLANNNPNAPTPTMSGSTTLNYFQVRKLQGPAVVQAAESVVAIYQNGDGTSLAYAASPTITYPTRIKDSHSAWNGSSFTAPISGTYYFCFSWALAGVANGITYAPDVRKNGVTFSRTINRQTETVFNQPGLEYSGLMPCNAGDTISIILYYNDGTSVAKSLVSSASLNTVTILRVGN